MPICFLRREQLLFIPSSGDSVTKFSHRALHSRNSRSASASMVANGGGDSHTVGKSVRSCVRWCTCQLSSSTMSRDRLLSFLARSTQLYYWSLLVWGEARSPLSHHRSLGGPSNPRKKPKDIKKTRQKAHQRKEESKPHSMVRFTPSFIVPMWRIMKFISYREHWNTYGSQVSRHGTRLILGRN